MGSTKERQRLLGERLNGGGANDDDQPRRPRSCWRALLLRLLEARVDPPATPAIEGGSEEDGAGALQREQQEQEQRLRTPEIDDLEGRIAELLEHFGFITSTEGACSFHYFMRFQLFRSCFSLSILSCQNLYWDSLPFRGGSNCSLRTF